MISPPAPNAGEAAADDLAHAIGAVDRGFLLVVTGAGISLASGIPTFRGTDPEAVWSHDVTTLGTHAFFVTDPVASWRWYLHRFARVLGARPNPAHLALVDLERWHLARGGELLLVTQNIDTLHRVAGSHALVEVHGAADKVRCTRPGCRYAAPSGSLDRAAIDQASFVADPRHETLPRCPACGALLRQHVLWFDEYYGEHEDYQWERVVDAARRSRLVLFMGTSFAVGVTAMVLDQALSRRVPVWSIDPGGAAPPHPRMRVVRAGAEVVLPAVMSRLAGPRP